jgi:hypothetical protein
MCFLYDAHKIPLKILNTAHKSDILQPFNAKSSTKQRFSFELLSNSRKFTADSIIFMQERAHYTNVLTSKEAFRDLSF